jgi:hypothetical protein
MPLNLPIATRMCDNERFPTNAGVGCHTDFRHLVLLLHGVGPFGSVRDSSCWCICCCCLLSRKEVEKALSPKMTMWKNLADRCLFCLLLCLAGAAFISWPFLTEASGKGEVVLCLADRVALYPGETVHLRVVASPDLAAGNTYSWSATGGRIIGAGPLVQWDFTDTQKGAYRATASVRGTSGKETLCSARVVVIGHETAQQTEVPCASKRLSPQSPSSQAPTPQPPSPQSTLRGPAISGYKTNGYNIWVVSNRHE